MAGRRWSAACQLFTKVAIVILHHPRLSFMKPENHVTYIPPPAEMRSTKRERRAAAASWDPRRCSASSSSRSSATPTVVRRTEAKEPEARHADRHPHLDRFVVCTVLYILLAHVLTGPQRRFFRNAGGGASVARSDATMPGYGWLSNAVTDAPDQSS
jgi:hypothetical protein